MPKERRRRVKFLNHKNVTRAYIEWGMGNPTHPSIHPLAHVVCILLDGWRSKSLADDIIIFSTLIKLCHLLLLLLLLRGYICLMCPINPYTLICVLIAFSTWQCNDALSHSPLQVVVATCCRSAPQSIHKIHTQSARGICPISRSNNWNSYTFNSGAVNG